ncbi:PilZ domain-containing protein [Thermodesulforhabdus norvegica]|uniref:PilZ domain-containing protein n=1 Tax=Thermodesulforhabdus norvegica TaxID=39841 RepID=A0A1I4TGD9_9BACT|nr:PilZ domain-containing protein [Thermodesulforhabdus norvegica]SFM75749.1 PilZ domain-containing protein [Thermodesulforhabdus norvegica]
MKERGKTDRPKEIDVWESPLRPYVSFVCDACGKTRQVPVEKFKKGGRVRLLCSCGSETTYLVNFRRSFRIKVDNIPVEIGIIKSRHFPEGAKLSGAIVDMSPLGLGIRVPSVRLFSRGDLVNLSFPLPNGIKDLVVKRAEVMCSNGEKGRIGVAFVDSYDGDRRIALFMRKQAVG